MSDGERVSPLSMRGAFPSGYFDNPKAFLENTKQDLIQKTVEDAEEFSDWLPTVKQRPGIRGAHRTKIGLQIHPKCFEYWEDRDQTKKRADFIENAEASAVATASHFLSCGKMYPELVETYLRPAMRYLQRSVILCTDRMDESIMKDVAAYMLVTPVAGVFLSESEIRDMDFADPLENLVQNFKPTIVVRESNTAGGSLSPSDLLHEALHYTGANNQGVFEHHDRDVSLAPSLVVEQRKGRSVVTGLSARCGKWKMSDRIAFIEALCLGAEAEVFDRISSCGMKSCTSVFTRSSLGLSGVYLDASDLSEAKAKALCEKIEAEGYCQTYTEEALRHRSLADTKLQKIRTKLRLRRNSLLSTAKISDEIIEQSGHEVKTALAKIKNNNCFKKIFKKTNGGYHLGQHALGTDPLAIYEGDANTVRSALTTFVSTRWDGFGCNNEAGKEDTLRFVEALAASAAVDALLDDRISYFIRNGYFRTWDIQPQMFQNKIFDLISNQARGKAPAPNDAVTEWAKYLLNIWGLDLRNMSARTTELFKPYLATKGATGQLAHEGFACEKLGLDLRSIVKKVQKQKTLLDLTPGNRCTQEN